MFSPKIEGIGPLIEFSGLNGIFYAAKAGSKPELYNGTYYGDNKYQFCFYFNTEFDETRGSVGKIDIYYATIGRLSGYRLFVESEDRGYIQENISKLLTERTYIDLETELPFDKRPVEIFFSWKID